MHPRNSHEPVCMIGHDLINNLSAIIGHCELLIEVMAPGTIYDKRVILIREIARAGVKKIEEHER